MGIALLKFIIIIIIIIIIVSHSCPVCGLEDSLGWEDGGSDEVPDGLLQGVHHRDGSEDATIGRQQSHLKKECFVSVQINPVPTCK